MISQIKIIDFVWTISFIMISDVKCLKKVNKPKIPRCDWLASGPFPASSERLEYLKSYIEKLLELPMSEKSRNFLN